MSMQLIFCAFFLIQYVAYQDGLIRAYNIHTYAVNYTLQRKIGATLLYYFIFYFT